jgi:hypothetical protein
MKTQRPTFSCSQSQVALKLTHSVKSMAQIHQNHLNCPQICSFNCQNCMIKTLRAAAPPPNPRFNTQKSHILRQLTISAKSTTQIAQSIETARANVAIQLMKLIKNTARRRPVPQYTLSCRKSRILRQLTESANSRSYTSLYGTLEYSTHMYNGFCLHP